MSDTVHPGNSVIRKYTLILFLLAAVIYGNILGNDFAMDDDTVIVGNTIVKQGLAGIPQILSTPRLYGYMHLPTDSWRPLSLIIFAIEYQFFGLSPAIGHLTSLLLFALSVVVLFRLLLRLFPSLPPLLPFVACMLFAAHPIHTEVVANIKSLDEILAFLFGISALAQLLRWQSGSGNRHLWLGMLLYLLACLSKESALTFILVIPFTLWLSRRGSARQLLTASTGIILLSALFLGLHHLVLSSHHTAAPIAEDFTTNALIDAPLWSERLPTAIYGMGKYLLMSLIPWPLICNYSYSAIPFSGWDSLWVWLSIIAYLAMVAVAIYRLVRYRSDPLAWGIMFFLTTLSLYSNIPILITSQFAERFLFFPTAGICLMLPLLLSGNPFKPLSIASPNPRKVFGILLPLIGIFAFLTVARNAEWKDNTTLFTADIAKSPDDCRLNYYMASTVPAFNIGGPNAAESWKTKSDYLYKALAIYPEFAEAHTELGKMYEAAGMFDSALTHNLSVLRTHPGNSIASFHAAMEFYASKKYPEAIRYFHQTLAVNPDYALASLNLAQCFADSQMPDSALTWYRYTLALDPAEDHALRGVALSHFSAAHYDSAAVYFQQLLQHQPNNIEDLNNLGAVYLYSGRYADAVPVFTQVLQLNPGYMVAWGNLGNAYLRSGHVQEAIICFRKQWASGAATPNTLSALADAYTRLGRADSAAYFRSLNK